MQIKRLIAAALVLMLLAGAAAYATGGTSADPVVTLSYIQQKFLPALEQKRDETLAAAEPAMQSLYDAALTSLAETEAREVVGDSASLAAQIEYEATMLALDNGFWRRTAAYIEVTLGAGERIVVAEGGEMRLLRGGATLAGERAAAIVNTRTGVQHYATMSMSHSTRYIIASGETAGAETVGGAIVSVLGSYQVIPAVAARHTDAALALGTLGVMEGTNKGYELERVPTRLEALIMFLRLIGEEDEALAFDGTQPFTDLPAWNDGEPARYVGYAYSKGYTNGISETTFGAYDAATLEMYLTFILRALGYSDADGDFDWVNAPTAAVSLGVITQHERESAARRSFSRDEVAYISWRALEAKCKDGATLADKLTAAGAFTAERYDVAKALGVRTLAPLDWASVVVEQPAEPSAEPSAEPPTASSADPSTEPSTAPSTAPSSDPSTPATDEPFVPATGE